MSNPNPGNITTQMWWLWLRADELISDVKLGGIYAHKKGYHGTRHENETEHPGNYSYAQFAVDREGPSDKSAAIDLTMGEAHMKVYTKRMIDAGKAKDPRTKYLREVFGTLDGNHVSGWDYAKHKTSTSDSSHLWHLHLSIHRKYVTSQAAMEAVISLLKGESLVLWLNRTSNTPVVSEKPENTPETGKNPSETVVSYGPNTRAALGSRTLRLGSRGTDVALLQRFLGLKNDGFYGSGTQSKVKSYQKMRGLTQDGIAGPKTLAPIVASVGKW